MTAAEIIAELVTRASPSTKRTLLRHGAVEPIYGVNIGAMKPIVKRLKGQQDLALELYATGVSDAMYLAGLVADGSKMSPAQLENWAQTATWHMISSCAVAWVAAEHSEAIALATRWIDDAKELVQLAGWNTLSAAVSVVPDAKLPISTLAALLQRCVDRLHSEPDRIRYAMNGFVICMGTYVGPLVEQAVETAQKIGKVSVDMGDTACQVPEAVEYILKSRRGAPVAKKRKTAKC